MKASQVRAGDLLVLLALVSAALLFSSQAAVAATTLENLMAAYNGESNAQAKYLAYATKAQEEGYLKVANLFRAAAESEGVHIRNHAEVIKKMGGTPKADITPPGVGSTRQNLEDAIKGETYESVTMYPEFIKQAGQDKNRAAARTFTLAQKVETNHARLYTVALQNLDGWKNADGNFYVCKVCGNTVEKLDFKRCPVCRESVRDYVRVK